LTFLLCYRIEMGRNLLDYLIRTIGEGDKTRFKGGSEF